MAHCLINGAPDLGASVSQDYHNNPAAVDASNAEQFRVTQDTTIERSGAATAGHDFGYDPAHQWRNATRELVLTGATALAAADEPQSQSSISITLTANALSNGLLLAETGTIVLTSPRDHSHLRSHPMRVLPVRLDTLSEVPTIRVLGNDVIEPIRLRLVVELTARNPHTAGTAVMTCQYDSIFLDARTPLAVLAFQLQHREPHW
jgi:hypothetical protein